MEQLRPREYLLYGGDATEEIGHYTYNDGANPEQPLGIYKITKIVFKPIPGFIRPSFETYGVLVIPTNISACTMAKFCMDVNNPKQCEHWWHAGPDRKFWEIKFVT